MSAAEYPHRPNGACPACGAPWVATDTPHPGSQECRHAAGCPAAAIDARSAT